MLFFLQFAEFNLQALRTQKRCITREFLFPAVRRHLGAFIIEIAEIPLMEMWPLKNAKFATKNTVEAAIIKGAIEFSVG